MLSRDCRWRGRNTPERDSDEILHIPSPSIQNNPNSTTSIHAQKPQDAKPIPSTIWQRPTSTIRQYPTCGYPFPSLPPSIHPSPAPSPLPSPFPLPSPLFPSPLLQEAHANTTPTTDAIQTPDPPPHLPPKSVEENPVPAKLQQSERELESARTQWRRGADITKLKIMSVKIVSNNQLCNDFR